MNKISVKSYYFNKQQFPIVTTIYYVTNMFPIFL